MSDAARARQREGLRELRSELIAEGAEPGRHLPELERRASTWPAPTARRRDLLLDTGAVFSLSSTPNLLIDYIDLLDRFDGSFLIPIVVLGEVITGEPRDAPIRRLIDADIDAQIVAMAEDLSYHSAVTLLTTDPEEIGAMVGVTGRTNIAVDYGE